MQQKSIDLCPRSVIPLIKIHDSRVGMYMHYIAMQQPWTRIDFGALVSDKSKMMWGKLELNKATNESRHAAPRTPNHLANIHWLSKHEVGRGSAQTTLLKQRSTAAHLKVRVQNPHNASNRSRWPQNVAG